MKAKTTAEKISALGAARFFEERRAKANRKEFRKILNRKGGEPPRPGDELPNRSTGVGRFAK
jgi:hypothetical protein